MMNKPVNRRGMLLIVVLVCLAMASVIFVVLAKQAVAARQTIQTRQWGIQAQWLAEAGIERAVARLAANADYSGETWKLSADELAGDAGAVVQIRTETIADQPNRRTIHVEADYPDDPHQRSQKIMEILADVAKK